MPKTRRIRLLDRNNTSYPLTVTTKSLAQLKRVMGRVLYDQQGKPAPHPTAEIIIHNQQGKEIFRQKAANLVACIIYED